MIILHAFWEAGLLQIWGEDSSRWTAERRQKALDFDALRARKHPYCCSADEISAALSVAGSSYISDKATICLPSMQHGPQQSSPFRRFVALPTATKNSPKPKLYPWIVPSLSLGVPEAVDLLMSIDDSSVDRFAEVATGDLHFDDSFAWIAAAVRVGLDTVANGHVLPSLTPHKEGHKALWQPVFTPENNERLRQLQSATPPSCRASWKAVRSESNKSSVILRSIVETTVDFGVRQSCPDLRPRTRGRQQVSPMAVWLAALSSKDPIAVGPVEDLNELSHQLDNWRADAVSASREVRTCLRLLPPLDQEPESDTPWLLEVMLQSVRDPSLLVPASRVWTDVELDESLSNSDASAPEALLRDLGRISRLYPEIEVLLETAQPEALELDTSLAVEFLQDVAPVLESAGFGVLLPSWWGTKRMRLNARLKSKSKSKSSSKSSGLLGLDGLVDYKWEVALGDDKITAQELKRLASLKEPLVRIRGEWVLLNQTDLEAALAIVKSNSSRKQMTAGEALRIGLGLQDSSIGLPVESIEANGWLGELLEADDHRIKEIDTPESFEAELRPYQLRGFAWLDFHDRLGLGACLADDMGLGKTAQLLALLERERDSNQTAATTTAPTLIVCPMSLVGNWQREAERFTPKLTVHIHHGSGRMTGENFIEAALDADMVITTYQLVLKDQELLQRLDWQRVVLDEAQNIKNPEAAQSRAARALPSDRRVALTGTPVENQLSELWSIMEFLNPGLLGTATKFRKTLANPIERDHDDEAADRLRRLTSPFVLRRLKTDRSIIDDLPEKLEIKTFCNLTREQASLYQSVVDDMLKRIEEAEGIQRKGLVLSTMLRLKQICNHPAQYLGDGSHLTGRSGKLERLEETIDEVIADGERALVFTQFADMGTMLHGHLRSRLGEEVAWLHGGIPKKKRDAMVERFQAADSDGPAIFLISLKAGGTGLNLTAANHVVHFDRWWNPAVENQATDRAFRIGQKRNVQIRKFIAVGTLEERIDQMIEQKKALAERIVGAGENWLTELSTAALREMIELDSDAVAEG